MHFYLEIITCDLLIYTMDHPKFIASNQKEESIIGHMGLNLVKTISSKGNFGLNLLIGLHSLLVNAIFWDKKYMCLPVANPT